MLKYPEGLLSGHILKYRLIHKESAGIFLSLALFPEVIFISCQYFFGSTPVLP